MFELLCSITMFKLLFSTFCSNSAPGSSTADSPFWAAIVKEQTKVVEIMLDNGQNPNEHFMKHTISPLHFAAQKGNLELCKLLIEKDANVNQRTNDTRGLVPLHFACARGNLPIVKLLVEEGNADIEVANFYGDTALIYALLENKKLDIAHYLVTRGVRIDQINFGVSPLHIIAEKGDFALCKFLIDNGANVNQKADACGRQLTPLHIACFKGHLQIVKLLVEEGNADIEAADSNGDTAFSLALKKLNFEIARFLLGKCARFDRVDKTGHSPLHFVAVIGNFAFCKFLVENGANVNQKTTDVGDHMSTALHFACVNGHLQIVKLLVEEGNADIEVATSNGDTALFLALKKRNFKIARYLYDKGARTDWLRLLDAVFTPLLIVMLVVGIGSILFINRLHFD
ncbi:hypothetical protein niasHS_013066 [Heterodera schachtii]|uniref:Uncharacterized protein n=2 Tax=Heterodera TaxID=34509 RepID=A0ABD2IBW8_HETSC